MRLLSALALVGTASRVSAHTPAGAGAGTRTDPVDLGDVTLNSWALTGTLTPGDVKHYKFTINGPTTDTTPEAHRFYTGFYVPGAGEPGFTYYVAFFGMPSSTACERWGDGWGRRRQLYVNGRRLGGGDGHDHHDHHAPAEKTSTAATRKTSEGTTVIMDSSAIPERVLGKDDGHDHCHAGEFCGYHKPEDTLVFVASPDTDLPNKFEPFSPTLFKPRGSCIADFPRGGEYRIAVWGDKDQASPKKFSVGLGLAERDVFAPQNLMTFDYILYDIQVWNGWNGFVLILPQLLFAIASLGLAALIKAKRPKHYGTSTGYPPPFKLIALFCGAILLGHLIMNISIFAWAASNAQVAGGTRELMFPLGMGIISPLLGSFFTTLIGLGAPVCNCCCASKRSATTHWSHRVTCFGFGLLHMFIHAGYLVVPALLIIASILPPSLADKDVVANGADRAKAKFGKVSNTTTSAGLPDVDKAPPTAGL